jgi:hypothetical protein
MKVKLRCVSSVQGVVFERCNSALIYYIHSNALRTLDWFLSRMKPKW